MSKKKVSVYVKGGKRAATAYYRFYKYFDRIDVDTVYRKMIPDNMLDCIMPITKHTRIVQVGIFIFIYLRVLFQLVKDLFRRPDIVVISRRLINRVFPPSFKALILLQKKCGAKIVWDFDDQIISTHEVSQRGFEWLSKKSDVIVVASPVLHNLVEDSLRGKVILLPTTDNEPFELYNNAVKEERLASFTKQVRLVWLATSVSLPFLREILPAIEKAGEQLNVIGKSLIMTVVCNYPLDYSPMSFQLENIKWERDVALRKLLQAHIGLMPLKDTPATRGKGGFKLIQYMSGALPVVGSKIGINADIIDGKNGIGVKELEIDEWYSAIMSITKDKTVWGSFSEHALDTWQRDYNFTRNLSIWKQIVETI